MDTKNKIVVVVSVEREFTFLKTFVASSLGDLERKAVL